jgi:hypothetical protein
MEKIWRHQVLYFMQINDKLLSKRRINFGKESPNTYQFAVACSRQNLSK